MTIYITDRYLINTAGKDDYLAVLVTDKTRLVGNRGRNLERMLRRDNAHKILAMAEMGADDEALFLALRSTGMYNLPHRDRFKK